MIDKDIVNEYIEKMLEVEGIILALPNYFTDLTPKLKTLIDRVGFVVIVSLSSFISWGQNPI